MCSDNGSLRAAHTPAVIMAGDFTVKAGWTLGPRQLNDFELVYFPSGSDTQYRLADGRIYRLSEPCFVLTCPQQEHTYIFDEKRPTRHLFIHFVTQDTAPENSDEPYANLPNTSPHLSVVRVPLLPSLMKHILHLTAFKPGGWRRRTSAHLNSILAEWDTLPPISAEALTDVPGTEVSGAFREARLPAFPGRSGDSGLPAAALPLQITQALQYIDRHLHRPLSISAIAEHIGWTHEHFTRVFGQHLGMTPRQAILQRRIERAGQLLVQTEASIKQIAYETGFQDEHYFSRCFTKLKGMTASQYRQRFADPRSRHLAPTDAFQASYPLNHYFT